MRSAIGLIAGPESPPRSVLINGRRVAASIAMPSTVLMHERMSAPRVLGGRAELDRRGDVRRQLHDQRLAGVAAHRGDHAMERVGVVAELDAAALDVRARDVELERGDPGHCSARDDHAT